MQTIPKFMFFSEDQKLILKLAFLLISLLMFVFVAICTDFLALSLLTRLF